jgi:hypothetical protein
MADSSRGKQKVRPATAGAQGVSLRGAMTVTALRKAAATEVPFDKGGVFRVTVMDDNGVEKDLTGRLKQYGDRMVFRTNGEFQVS